MSDDGAGFDASRLATAGGLAFIMMRERATQREVEISERARTRHDDQDGDSVPMNASSLRRYSNAESGSHGHELGKRVRLHLAHHLTSVRLDRDLTVECASPTTVLTIDAEKVSLDTKSNRPGAVEEPHSHEEVAALRGTETLGDAVGFQCVWLRHMTHLAHRLTGHRPQDSWMVASSRDSRLHAVLE